MKTDTIGGRLHGSYANLAMAHAAVSRGAERFSRTEYRIRARLFAGLEKGTMRLGSFVDDERIKLTHRQVCCYCGSEQTLSLDHLLPKARGGGDGSDNIVWACRSCNSSKGGRDVLEWLSARERFPPLLLLRRYLKLAVCISEARGLMDCPIAAAPDDLPFSLAAVPIVFPPPSRLRLWVTPTR